MCHAHIIVGLQQLIDIFERHGNAKQQIADAFSNGNEAKGVEQCHVNVS